mmetsp:Transcript_18749/g.35188  ORF Transcript_18749/g.35188 Transcript_18749/m.35188 type:complete len:193 (-) Transcript_18749:40-618(-)
MQRSEMSGLVGFDGRAEQSVLRRAGDAEARCRRLLEAKRQAISEKQLQLQMQVAAAEEALRREKEAALEMQTEVSLERWELQQSARSLAKIWPSVEETTAALGLAQEKVLQLRHEAQEHSQNEKLNLEIASSIYELYAAASGIRWDLESDDLEGYIAIGQKARAFKVDAPGTKESADALWEEIEACSREDLS